MSQTNMYRPGIDVTQADLVPQSKVCDIYKRIKNTYKLIYKLS